MQWLYIIAAVFLVGVVRGEEFCYDDSIDGCHDKNDDLINCNANFSGFHSNSQYLQSYANDQIAKSYDYLLLATNFGSHVKNRPGFEKLFRELSNTAWENALNMIKHITRRGGSHDFRSRVPSAPRTDKKKKSEMNELNALALALETEKILSNEAHSLHERYMHANHKTHYDPEIAHFLEEEYIEPQAKTIRKLSGYVNDLKRLIKYDKARDESKSLNVYLFDEYLLKQ